MTWIASLVSCIRLCISSLTCACLNLVTTSLWAGQGERRNVLSLPLHISVWSLSIFIESLGWESNVLPGRLKRNTPRIKSHSPEAPGPERTPHFHLKLKVTEACLGLFVPVYTATLSSSQAGKETWPFVETQLSHRSSHRLSCQELYYYLD